MKIQVILMLTLLLLCSSSFGTDSTQKQSAPSTTGGSSGGGFDDSLPAQDQSAQQQSAVDGGSLSGGQQAQQGNAMADQQVVDKPENNDAVVTDPPKGGPTSVSASTNFADNCSRAKAYKESRFGRWNKVCFYPGSAELGRLDMQYANQCELNSSNVYNSYKLPSKCCSDGSKPGCSAASSCGYYALPEYTSTQCCNCSQCFDPCPVQTTGLPSSPNGATAE